MSVSPTSSLYIFFTVTANTKSRLRGSNGKPGNGNLKVREICFPKSVEIIVLTDRLETFSPKTFCYIFGRQKHGL